MIRRAGRGLVRSVTKLRDVTVENGRELREGLGSIEEAKAATVSA